MVGSNAMLAHESHLLEQIARNVKDGIKLILDRLHLIETKERTMSAAVDRLTASNTSLIAKIDALIAANADLAQKLAAAAGADDAPVNAVADALDAEALKIDNVLNPTNPAPAA